MEKTIIISLLVVIGLLLVIIIGGFYAFVRYKSKVHKQAKICDNRVCAKQNFIIETQIILSDVKLTAEEKSLKISEGYIALNKKLEAINNADTELEAKQEEQKAKLIENLKGIDLSKIGELIEKFKGVK